jgi:hypothetical protein
VIVKLVTKSNGPDEIYAGFFEAGASDLSSEPDWTSGADNIVTNVGDFDGSFGRFTLRVNFGASVGAVRVTDTYGEAVGVDSFIGISEAFDFDGVAWDGLTGGDTLPTEGGGSGFLRGWEPNPNHKLGAVEWTPTTGFSLPMFSNTSGITALSSAANGATSSRNMYTPIDMAAEGGEYYLGYMIEPANWTNIVIRNRFGSTTSGSSNGFVIQASGADYTLNIDTNLDVEKNPTVAAMDPDKQYVVLVKVVTHTELPDEIYAAFYEAGVADLSQEPDWTSGADNIVTNVGDYDGSFGRFTIRMNFGASVGAMRLGDTYASAIGLDGFAAFVGAAPVGDMYVSPWFGGFTMDDPDYIVHEGLGLLYVGSVDSSEGMWMYAYALGEWVFTNETWFPALYGVGDGVAGWYYYFYIEELGAYVFDYVTRTWVALQG